MNKLEIEPGQFVAIFGPGPIGIMMTQIAKHTGAGKVAMIGARDYRLEEAKKWGADYIFNTKDEKSPYYVKDLKAAIADVTHGKLADRAINPAGPNEAFEQAIDITGGGAILVHFGLPNSDDIIHVPADAFHKADKQIRASWLAPGVWPRTIRHDRQRSDEPGTAGQHGCTALPGRPSHRRPARPQRQPDQGAGDAVRRELVDLYLVDW